MSLTALVEQVHDRFVHPRRVRVLADCLAPLLPPVGRVLDVGCGDGRLARAIAGRRPHLRLTGVDVLVRARLGLAAAQVGGTALPFADGTFDAVLCVDVLHHAPDPLALLDELARVGRRLVLKDHTCDGWLAGATLRVMDRVGNRRHGVALPFRYLSRRDWDRAFARRHLKVERWMPRLPIYMPPVDWVCGRSLHFVAVLSHSRARP